MLMPAAVVVWAQMPLLPVKKKVGTLSRQKWETGKMIVGLWFPQVIEPFGALAPVIGQSPALQETSPVVLSTPFISQPPSLHDTLPVAVAPA